MKFGFFITLVLEASAIGLLASYLTRGLYSWMFLFAICVMWLAFMVYEISLEVLLE